MTSALISAASAFQEVELTFPNLFGGFTISYFQGFELFGIKIYWYGVLITIGVILAYLYAMRRCESFGVGRDRMFDVVFVALIGGFLGARIYYCVFQTLDPNGMDYNFVTVFTTIRDGGLAIYGGIIGGFLTGWIACRVRKVNFRSMADIASFGFLIGQGIGRWGNFINQEAFGAQCSPDWIFGMTSVDIIARDGLEAGALVHPCFLYESVWCLIGFIGLHFYSKKLRSFDGEIMLLYIAWYGLGRAWIEGLRTDSLMAGQFRVSQLLAAVSFVAATVMVIVFKILTEKKKIPLFVTTDAWREQQETDKAAAAAQRKKAADKKAKREQAQQAPSILSKDADDITLGGEQESDSSEESEQEKSEETEEKSEEAEQEASDETEEHSEEAQDSSESEDENGSTDN